MLLLVVCVHIFPHFTSCMFVCLSFHFSNFLLFEVVFSNVAILFLISHYVYVSKHCVRKCVFVCHRVSIVNVRVRFSVVFIYSLTKKGLYLYFYGICIAK